MPNTLKSIILQDLFKFETKGELEMNLKYKAIRFIYIFFYTNSIFLGFYSLICRIIIYERARISKERTRTSPNMHPKRAINWYTFFVKLISQKTVKDVIFKCFQIFFFNIFLFSPQDI